MPTYTISALSWNVHGLPWPLDLHAAPWSHIPRHHARLRNISDFIVGSQPELVTLQEVWINRDIHELGTRLRANGYYVLDPPSGGFPRPTGLITAVRSPWTVERHEIKRYASSGSPWRLWEGDGISHKGFEALWLRHAQFGSCIVMNTHLQSQYSARNYRAVRAAQVDELTEYAASIASPGIPLLAMGDFNTYPEPLDAIVYSKLSQGKWTDLTVAARAQCRCKTNFNPNGKGMEGWIDYMLAFRDPGVQVEAQLSLVQNRSIDDPYSDHQGLQANITVSRMEKSSATAFFVVAAASMTSLDRRRWMSAVAAGLFDLTH